MSVEAVDRVVAILEHLAERPEGEGVLRLSDRAGLAPSTMHRYLSSLSGHGIVRQAPDRTYHLTHRLYLLGLGAAKGFELERHAEASLQRLADASGETACMMVREGDQSVCIARITSGHQLKIEARIGSRADLRLGSTGRVLLAFAPSTVREELLARPPLQPRTPNTLTHPDRIRDLLDAIRDDGYYVSRSQVDDGVIAVAAPVRDRAGEVIAAVAVVAPETRLATQDVLSRTVDLVKGEVGVLSANLGYAKSRPLIERNIG